MELRVKCRYQIATHVTFVRQRLATTEFRIPKLSALKVANHSPSNAKIGLVFWTMRQENAIFGVTIPSLQFLARNPDESHCSPLALGIPCARKPAYTGRSLLPCMRILDIIWTRCDVCQLFTTPGALKWSNIHDSHA